jgi:hypothetical protein
MGKVLHFLRPEKAFDSETIAVLAAAYAKASAGIENRGQPEIMRHVAARRIIALASKGERDPDRLCAAALVTVTMGNGVDRRHEPNSAPIIRNLSAARLPR